MRHSAWQSNLSPMRSLLTVTVAWLSLLLPATAELLPTPPDQDAPSGRQRGGASRGNCLDYQDLTALVPVIDGIVWSQTHSPTPDFFYYVPKALTADMPLELVVQDNQDNYVFRRQFSVDAPSGIITVPTTAATTELIPGETYSWTFSIYCDAARPSASVSVFGTIKRVTDSAVIEPALNLTPPIQLELARNYAASGIWHEAMALTLSLYQSGPANADYLETLESLLEQAGLTDISPTVQVYEVSP